ncbi:MAG: cyclic nucleotide-binding domain-containing protein [Nitrospinae bacterium]|nr:cyclic nucleotide-binding domain-containing protein [Nitrospinota bacterium]
METLEPIIAAHPFFKDLDPKYRALITGCASNVRFEAGESVFREGEEANHFYIIRQGQVGLEINAAQRGIITIETIGEGDVLGWSWLVPPYRWHYDAQALTLVRAIALDGKCLRQKCAEDHGFGYELFSRFFPVLIDRLQHVRLQLLDVYGAHK